MINEHDEEGEDEELYFVQSGHARFELDGERVDAPAGTFVFARPSVKRTAFAEEPGTTILAVGGTPGQAYEPTGWELWAPAGRLYREGRYAEGAQQVATAVRISREHKLVVPQLWTTWISGVVAIGKGEYDDALVSLEQHVAFCEKVGDEVMSHRVLNTLGWLYLELGNLEPFSRHRFLEYLEHRLPFDEARMQGKQGPVVFN